MNMPLKAGRKIRAGKISGTLIVGLCCFLSPVLAAPVITSQPQPATVLLGNPASFSVSATGSGTISYQWRRNGQAVSGATDSTFVFTPAADDDGALYSVLVSDSTGSAVSQAVSLTLDFGMPGPAHTNRVVAITDPWRYNVSNIDLGTGWRGTGYSDTTWPSGGGLLYVETGDLPAPKTTPLPLTGGSLPTTCYFRSWFSNVAANAYSVRLVANAVIDDGLVLYLNGDEVLRDGLDAGTVTHTTPATLTVGNAAYRGPYELPVGSLVSGNNLLAAEVHQRSAGSSDIVMGLTLDLIWTERVYDTAAPMIASTDPAAGSSVTSLDRITVVFDEGVTGVDAADLLINGVPATGLTVVSASEYTFLFPAPAEGGVSVTWAAGHGVTDLSGSSHPFAGAGFSYLYTPPSPYSQLSFSRVFQSSDSAPATSAEKAVDGSAVSFSLTDNLPGSYWMGELGRPFELQRIELVNRAAPDDSALAGLTLSVLNMDDQVVYETVLANPGSGAVTAVNLPGGTVGRAVRIGLSGTQTNGAGTYQVGLAEVRAIGLPQIPYMPEPYVGGGGSDVQITGFSVSQTTDYSSSYPASNAVDGDTGTFSHTDSSTPNNYWIADLGAAGPVARVELVNRSYASTASRMDNLVIRVLDEGMNSVASDVTSNPGSGATYTFNTPPNTTGRYVKVGLENGETNGRGDYVVQLAEVRIYSEVVDTTPPPPTNNLASSKRSYMLRLTDELAPAGNVNDDDMNTEAVTTSQTVDGYWEVDLGGTYALYGVRAVSASDVGNRLTNTVCRLFDEDHQSVLEKPVTGLQPAFDVDLDGPVFARYVRIGLEDKTRTDGRPGGYIGFREVEVFGRPAAEVGIQSFSISDPAVASGQNITLDWALEEVKRAEIFPAIGSAGPHTDTNGVGSISQTMTASTEFIMAATNNAGIFTKAVGVEVDSNPLPVVISEVVADNKYSLEDGYGDAPDWIELRNTGNSTVDLTGWGLSDNPSKPMKWVFPATNMPPHSTLIVFASGKAVSLDPAGMLHADFALGKNGETVQLTASDGTSIIDSVAYPELDTDLAYGRALTGGWTFMEPTPAAVNTGRTYDGWLHPLNWSHSRGFYETNFTLTVSSDDPSATILYSLDGTAPSIPYTGGLSITGTSVVRIQAVWPGYKPSKIQTKSFIFLDDVIGGLDTGITADPVYGPRVKPGLLALPTLSLVVAADGDAIDAVEYDEQACSLEILWPDGRNPIQEDCGISRFGGAYTYFAKKAFSLAFRREYGNGKLKAPLFDGFDRGTLTRTSFDRLHLRGGNHDWTRSFGMSDRFIQDSMLDMGSLNPHGRFVHVYLNGEYCGQYNCKEVLNESFLADYLGGKEEDYVSVKGNDNVSGAGWVIGAGDPPNPEPWERVRALRNDFEAVRPYLDVSHFIDFMLLWCYGGAESEFRACGPVEAGSGYKFWMNDPDGFLNRGRTNPTKINNTAGPGYIWSGLLGESHPDFKMLLADRIYKNFFNHGAMSGPRCTARLKARMDETRDSFLAECARWNRSYTNWESSAEDAYNNYFPTYADELVSQWRSNGWFPSFDPPAFSQYGGPVLSGYQPVLSSSAGTIYYTLDGTDPRLPGGAVNPAAAVWSAGAVTITEDTTITTRVRASDGTWSALAEPRFLLGSRQAPATGDLLVTEINYNPAGSDEYEFIEIWNSGTNLLDLSGVSVSNAVRFVFPEYTTLNPGGLLVVVENAAAFAERYQTPSSPWYWDGIEVAGEWVGGLSDGGETVSLVASNGTQISACSYRSDGDWPGRPDGGGSSLQIRFPSSVPKTPAAQAAYLADGRNWSESSLYHGSPGRFEAAGNSVVINEVLAHTDVWVDWIELFNPGSSAADLSGLGLTDDMNQPNRYVFPNGTSIPANGYLTISAATLGYGFSELGSEAALLELSGSNIIRIIDRVDFPAVEREEPFGRYERSDGEIDFTELSAITPGAANAAPRVGPVVISEIMYAPGAGKSEYVEFTNISGAPVALYDAAIPSNIWKFAGAGTFAFPQGTVLQTDETVMLCGTNPAVFRAQYGVPAQTRVFGPWSGGLAAEGEKLRLLYPGDPEPDGFVPMYRADHVSYRTNNVWPAAASGGISLERWPLNSYGNDPASWRILQPGGTPGFAMGNSYPMGTAIATSAGAYPGISFSAILGETYEVRYTDSLIDPDWQPLAAIPAAVTNRIDVMDSAATNSTRYYRVIWYP